MLSKNKSNKLIKKTMDANPSEARVYNIKKSIQRDKIQIRNSNSLVKIPKKKSQSRIPMLKESFYPRISDNNQKSHKKLFQMKHSKSMATDAKFVLNSSHTGQQKTLESIYLPDNKGSPYNSLQAGFKVKKATNTAEGPLRTTPPLIRSKNNLTNISTDSDSSNSRNVSTSSKTRQSQSKPKLPAKTLATTQAYLSHPSLACLVERPYGAKFVTSNSSAKFKLQSSTPETKDLSSSFQTDILNSSLCTKKELNQSCALENMAKQSFKFIPKIKKRGEYNPAHSQNYCFDPNFPKISRTSSGQKISNDVFLDATNSYIQNINISHLSQELKNGNVEKSPLFESFNAKSQSDVSVHQKNQFSEENKKMKKILKLNQKSFYNDLKSKSTPQSYHSFPSSIFMDELQNKWIQFKNQFEQKPSPSREKATEDALMKSDEFMELVVKAFESKDEWSWLGKMMNEIKGMYEERITRLRKNKVSKLEEYDLLKKENDELKSRLIKETCRTKELSKENEKCKNTITKQSSSLENQKKVIKDLKNSLIEFKNELNDIKRKEEKNYSVKVQKFLDEINQLYEENNKLGTLVQKLNYELKKAKLKEETLIVLLQSTPNKKDKTKQLIEMTVQEEKQLVKVHKEKENQNKSTIEVTKNKIKLPKLDFSKLKQHNDYSRIIVKQNEDDLFQSSDFTSSVEESIHITGVESI